MPAPYFLGIDIGTQGARLALMDVEGNLVESAEESFPLDAGSREEQSPQGWWDACYRSMQALITELRTTIDVSAVKAIAVSSTSGTVIPLDKNNRPLHNAIMYSDKRSAAEARICTEAAQNYNEGYTAFNSSSGLSKMVWFVRNFPDKVAQLHHWAHAADYITGKLSGRWGISDFTNVLKSGYDVRNELWPAYIYEKLPLKREWLPEVLPSGTPVGLLLPELAKELGLADDVQVVTGMTDGCASQMASGAVNLGDWNTTIGTTLVIKGVTKNEIRDPGGRLYCHRHPQGWWMPGGASNTGADWVAKEFGGRLYELDEQARQLIPTRHIAYPLRQEGERFPFIAPGARGFEPPGLKPAERFAANMEGVAYIERYAFEIIEQLSGEKVNAVFTAGGASNSDTWLTIRSNVLNRPIYKMKYVTGAVGAAIIAASRTHFASVTEAAAALTRIEKEVLPNSKMAATYDKRYREFIKALRKKGYIDAQYA